MDNKMKMVEFSTKDLDILKTSLKSLEEYRENWRLMNRSEYLELTYRIVDLDNLIFKLERISK